MRSAYDGTDVERAVPRIGRQRAYVRMCARQAARSAMQHKHGAVVVERESGRVIAKGFNTHARHAECDAILKLRKLPHVSVDLYVVRLRTHKRDRSDACMGYSKPCERCATLIRSVPRIRTVYYSLNLRYD